MKKFIKTFVLFGFIIAIASAYAFQKKDEVYAIVGNKVIMKNTIQKRANLENIPFDSALKQLIEEDMLLYEADKEKIKVSSPAITQRLNEIEKKFPSSSEFLKFLIKNGFPDIKSFKKYLSAQLKIESLIQKNVVSKIQISPVEIFKEMQGINPGKMLMLKTMSFPSKKDAEAFVKEFNKNPSKEIDKMQDIGWVNVKELNADVVKVIASTSKGKISPPLKSSNKWTVFYVENIKENTIKDIYIKAREKIFKEKYQKQLNQYIHSLKNKIPVTIAAHP